MSPESGLLVSLARRLDCRYPRDHCDKHRGEDGFTRCSPCAVRDLAEAIGQKDEAERLVEARRRARVVAGG